MAYAGRVSELFSLEAPLGSRCIFPLRGSHWRLILVQPAPAKQKVMAGAHGEVSHGICMDSKLLVHFHEGRYWQ